MSFLLTLATCSMASTTASGVGTKMTSGRRAGASWAMATAPAGMLATTIVATMTKERIDMRRNLLDRS